MLEYRPYELGPLDGQPTYCNSFPPAAATAGPDRTIGLGYRKGKAKIRANAKMEGFEKVNLPCLAARQVYGNAGFARTMSA